jgi:hypothetical protein
MDTVTTDDQAAEVNPAEDDESENKQPKVRLVEALESDGIMTASFASEPLSQDHLKIVLDSLSKNRSVTKLNLSTTPIGEHLGQLCAYWKQSNILQGPCPLVFTFFGPCKLTFDVYSSTELVLCNCRLSDRHLRHPAFVDVLKSGGNVLKLDLRQHRFSDTGKPNCLHTHKHVCKCVVCGTGYPLCFVPGLRWVGDLVAQNSTLLELSVKYVHTHKERNFEP